MDGSRAEEFDRLPPHSIEAERCLIASMLVAGIEGTILQECLAVVERDHFYSTDHRVYFDAIRALRSKDKPVDPVIVRDELQKRQQWEEVGGNDYLAMLLNTVPSASHAMTYARIVREKYIGRCLISLTNEINAKVYEPYQDENHFLHLCQKLERQAASLAVSGVLPSIITLRDAIEGLVRQKEEGVVRRIATDLTELDDFTGGGIPVGKWTLIAGKPGMGKSQLGKQILLNASRRGVPCGLISIEEDRMKIAANMLANIADLNNEHVTCHKWDQADYGAAYRVIQNHESTPYLIVDSSESLSELEASATLMAIKHRCELVVIDHIHLADAQAPHKSREQQVALISGTLKKLAKRLDIALVGLCQLNRGGGDDYQRPPILKDLRDSGSLEADGDLILMLHRADYYRQAGQDETNQLDCYIRKQKDGKLGELPLYFDGDHQRITNWIGSVPQFDSPSPYGNTRPYAPRTNGISFDD